jgi:hypothetical protein
VCPFELESAYAMRDGTGSLVGESLPFTNATHNFVDTLDYVLTQSSSVNQGLTFVQIRKDTTQHCTASMDSTLNEERAKRDIYVSDRHTSNTIVVAVIL